LNDGTLPFDDGQYAAVQTSVWPEVTARSVSPAMRPFAHPPSNTGKPAP
jgi:hypothetical protein